MQDFLDHWLLWLGLGGGTVTAIVLAFVAPSVLTVIGNIVTAIVNLAQPLLKPAFAAIGTGLGIALSAIFTGATRTLDDGKQIAFVLSVVMMAFGGGAFYQGQRVSKAVDAEVSHLHQCYVMSPRPRAPPICRR